MPIFQFKKISNVYIQDNLKPKKVLKYFSREHKQDTDYTTIINKPYRLFGFPMENGKDPRKTHFNQKASAPRSQVAHPGPGLTPVLDAGVFSLLAHTPIS